VRQALSVLHRAFCTRCRADFDCPCKTFSSSGRLFLWNMCICVNCFTKTEVGAFLFCNIYIVGLSNPSSPFFAVVSNMQASKKVVGTIC